MAICETVRKAKRCSHLRLKAKAAILARTCVRRRPAIGLSDMTSRKARSVVASNLCATGIRSS